MTLDIKTALLAYAITYVACTGAIAIVWYQSRKRFAGLSLWLIALALQSVGVGLLLFQGLLPSLVSIIFANTAIVAGILILYIGLEIFTGKRSSQLHNYIFMSVFILIHVYYTYIHPSLATRIINVSAATMVFGFQIFWLMMRRVHQNMRYMTRMVVIVFGFEIAISFIRILIEVVIQTQSDTLLHTGTGEAWIIILYTVLAIALTFSLILMVNRRLLDEVYIYAKDLETKQELLRESEDKFYKAFNGSPDLMAISSIDDGTLIEVNEAAHHITGYSRDEIIGHSTLELNLWDDDKERERYIATLLDKKQVVNMETRFRRKSGEVRYGVINGEFLEIWGKQYILTCIGDITERKKAEEALRQSEERYRTILKEIEDSYFEVDLAGNLTFVNDSTCRNLGYSSEELAGMNYQTFTVKNDVKHVYNVFNEVYTTGKPNRGFTWKIVRKDGTEGFVEAAISLMRNPKGDNIGLRGVGRDITERIQMVEALRQSEERYRTVLDEMDEGYYEQDIAGNFTYVNDAMTYLLGYSRDDLTGMNYREYVSEKDAKDYSKEWNKVYRTNVPLQWHPLELIAKNGSKVFVENSLLPRKNEQGEIIGFRGISRNISERMRIEAERRDLEQKTQLASRLASIGEMAAGVAHEINNPLTGVIGYAHLLTNRTDLPVDIKGDLADINEGAQRVADIVKRLLAFSRQTKPERKLVDINELIDSILVLRAYHLRVNNIQITTELAPDLPVTIADPGQLQQVFLNIIVNAEKEMKLAHDKGKLTITTERYDNTITISFKDNGPGIKPKIMDKIFNPFFTTRDIGQGTGLGLSLCHGIVTEHKGKIYAESKPGKGATFIVELPIVTEP